VEDDTFDYGLDPDESFIPLDDVDVDRSRPHVMTVLGPIDPGALGPANLLASFVPRDPQADLGAVLTEIHECAAVGINALVDLRPIENEMQARAAQWLAERADIHLIVATGVDVSAGTVRNINQAVTACSTGLHGTLVAPGALVVADDHAAIQIGEAIRESTGLPLLIDRRSRSDAQPITLSEEILIVSAADAPSLEATSAVLLLDLTDRSQTTKVAEWIQHSVDSGRILIGYDPAMKEPELFSRWSWLIEEFPIALMEAGMLPLQVRSLFVDAAADALTINPPPPTRC
jgi:hypothetical protein